ncbi:esterase family protein [Streptococcus chenjunshii]|uniref:Esterase family protein n=1 Tax=Streptococcus chenjunshii TaxID=2173853 RepID=A0A372KIT3_9STRE|nr:alpha/beta hydrolase family protein [Streptococcus chenjunshii]AXQ79723.1 esterase family protein [Streptococcus chenjunshii]RFU50002.1 esterase family protein [Streptococcus chenjunshii]RFU52202.1 esterase family protein [Streptococcus chenjunshii]
MAFLQIEYHSQALAMERRVNVIYPDAAELSETEAKDSDIPVLYLLHGMGGNENSWQKRTNIERLLRHTNLIVVMPSTDLGWYTDTAYGMPYFTAIAEELPQILQRFFPNMSRKREKTFIAGLSMGGYGAYKIALATDKFSHAASFSGALGLGLEGQELTENLESKRGYWEGVFGDLEAEEVSEHFLTRIAEHSDKKTKFYAWCGYEDYLYQSNERAVKELTALGLDIDYHTSHGKHEWYYWNQQLEKLFDWLPIHYVKEERLS